MRSRSSDTWLSIVPSWACLSEDTRAYKATRRPLMGWRFSFMPQLLLEEPAYLLRRRRCCQPCPPLRSRQRRRMATLPHTPLLGNLSQTDWPHSRVPPQNTRGVAELLVSWATPWAGLPILFWFPRLPHQPRPRGYTKNPRKLLMKLETGRFCKIVMTFGIER